MKPNESFERGVSEALQVAQLRANREGRSIKVGNRWVNPSSAALAKRPKTDKYMPEPRNAPNGNL